MKDLLTKLMDQYLSQLTENNSDEKVCSIKGAEQMMTTGSVSYVEMYCLQKKNANLIAQHSRKCQLDLNLVAVTKIGHVLIHKFRCDNCHEVTWESSVSCGGNYKMNYKVLASYICSGMTSKQYEKNM